MVVQNLTTIIVNGANNPECSFYVGAFTGQFIAIRYMIFVVILFFVYKIVDRLAFEPFISWVKKKVKGEK